MKTTKVKSEQGVDIEVFERDLKVDGAVLLGRHRTHDPKSRKFNGLATLPEYMYVNGEITLVDAPVLWKRMAPIWKQGDVGSCTACAALGCLMSAPYYKEGFDFSAQHILAVYAEETIQDDSEIPGQYPPDDTGSSGLYSMKVLKNHGWIDSYVHGFNLKSTLAMIQHGGPVSLGLPWYDSMMRADKWGLVEVSKDATMIGGHQVVGQGVDERKGLVRCANSWGDEWGDKGYFDLTFDTLERLLGEGGDVIQPVVTT